MKDSELNEEQALVPVKEQIFEEYITEFSSAFALSRLHKIPLKTVLLWIDEEGWEQRRTAIAKKRYQEAVDQYRVFVAEHRQGILDAEITSVGKLHEHIQTLLMNIDPTSSKASYEIERLTRALKSTSEVSQKLVALSDKELQEDSGPKGNLTLIVQGGQGPRISEKDAIDVEFEDS